MSKQPSQANTKIPLGTMSDTAVYSASIQQAMRYDKLRSSDYPIVMTIMHAVSQGFSKEQWEKEQQRTVSILTKQPTDKKTPYADAANRYEQTIACFKDLLLWPW